ncbi:MAG: hypothetical protein WDO70_02765 [Alphaproteobacteria bacterium]
MVYSVPRGNGHGPGRSLKAIDEDGQHLQNLTRFLPDTVEAHVQAYIAAILPQALQEAVGDMTSKDLMRGLAKSVGKKTARKLVKEVEQLTSGEVSPAANPQHIATETNFARSELTRNWVDFVLYSRELLDAKAAEPIRLDADLAPVIALPRGMKEDWDLARQETLEALAENIAMTPPQIQEAYRALRVNLLVETAKQPVPLPFGIELVRRSDELYVQPRARQAAAL